MKKTFLPVDIALVAEATYPFVKGGVSSVMHQIIENHPDLSFGVIHIAWDRQSPHTPKYQLPANIKWVFPVYLNEEKPPSAFFNLLGFSKSIDSHEAKAFAKELTRAIAQTLDGSYEEFQKLYHKYFNPLTRKKKTETILHSSQFIDALLEQFSNIDMSFEQLFWSQKEFINLAFSLLDQRYPLAKIYHSHTAGYAGLAAAMAAQQNSSHFLLTEHSLYLKDIRKQLDEQGQRDSRLSKRISLWQRWFEFVGHLTYGYADCGTYLYPDIAEQAVELGMKKENIRIIPNGVCFDRFEDVRALQLAKSRGVDVHLEKAFYRLTFIGRIVPVKGVLDLIDAVNNLRELAHFSFHLDVFGPYDEDPPYYQQCIERVDALDLQSLITFYGSQDVSKVLKNSDVILLSSHSEALPVAVLEGMACGIPIVGTDVGAMNQILVKPLPTNDSSSTLGPAGVIVPPQSPALFSDAIVRVLSNPLLMHTFRQNGPVRVKNHFEAQGVMNLYRSIYKSYLEPSDHLLAEQITNAATTLNKGCAI